jgi:ribonuclease P protein component
VHSRFRLTSSTDIKRVRRLGKSYAHPLIVLVVHPNDLDQPRIAISAGRSVGAAVERNRAKRRLREAIRPTLPQIASGWDMIFLARQPIVQASWEAVQAAVLSVLRRAKLI